MLQMKGGKNTSFLKLISNFASLSKQKWQDYIYTYPFAPQDVSIVAFTPPQCWNGAQDTSELFVGK